MAVVPIKGFLPVLPTIPVTPSPDGAAVRLIPAMVAQRVAAVILGGVASVPTDRATNSPVAAVILGGAGDARTDRIMSFPLRSVKARLIPAGVSVIPVLAILFSGSCRGLSRLPLGSNRFLLLPKETSLTR